MTASQGSVIPFPGLPLWDATMIILYILITLIYDSLKNLMAFKSM